MPIGPRSWRNTAWPSVSAWTARGRLTTASAWITRDAALTMRSSGGSGHFARAGIPFGILTVIPFGADPLAVHRHLLSLGSAELSYLMPDYTHDTIGPIRARYGKTPCADFLAPVFDDWWFHGTLDVKIGDFWNIARVILGGPSQIETLGSRPPFYVCIETDGDIEGLDVLRSCAEGMAGTGLHVNDAAFSEIAQVSDLHRQSIFEGMPLPRGCLGCPEEKTCAGGYLPHRYSRDNRFDNPSVWCADILELFSLIRRRLKVTAEQTDRRRVRLSRLSANGRSRTGVPRANSAS